MPTQLPEVLGRIVTKSLVPSPRRAVLTRRQVRRQPNQVIDKRQEMILGVLFGLLGLWLTSLVFLNAETLVCALGEWTSECAPRVAAAAE